ncbi:MAG: Na/Pi symporter [Verrucomicrobiota bacterium]|jgi:Na/Pi-cotransporter|nr:Na/Pi symporter [Verrucomicrobiota bacterium]
MTRSQGSFFVAAPAVLAFALLTGCSRTPEGLEPDTLTLVTAETQLGQPGATVTNGLRLEVVSKPRPGLLGGAGERYPVGGVKLAVVPVDAASGIRATPAEGTTDAGGTFVCDVTLGRAFGDQYLDIVCPDAPELRRRVRFVAGVAVANGDQEVSAGSLLPEPVRVRLTGGDGAPVVGEAVYFTLAQQPGKAARVTRPVVRTDTNGVAEVGLKTDASATGVYEVRVEVSNPRDGVVTRPFFVRAMAMNVYGVLITILCGVAFFIYGMTLLSEGLQQIAGNKLKTALSYITQNRVSAIFAGTLVTALVQSSSATTVMTIGFVNAGLLSLQQAIGVVFGANIGTTVTGQIIAFKLDGVALPAIVIGVVGILVARKAAWQGLARTVLGFGLLFFGMNLMAGELKDAGAFPSFIAFFRTFDCTPPLPGQPMPLGAVLGAIGIGTLTTMIVQSSAVTIGLTMALASCGLLNFWTAFPIVLGDNIGTTITAILASLNTNRTAKQAAVAHSMFNIIGTCIMVALFYVPWRGTPCFLALVDAVTTGAVFHGENLGRHIAMAHTLFNVTNVALLTVFIPQLAWLCEHLIPAKRAAPGIVRLEPHLLNTPPLALVCAVNALADMTEKAWRVSLDALRGYMSDAPIPVETIKKAEDEVDTMQGEIMDYLVQLTRKELTEGQAKSIPVLMHCVNDAERISDLAYLVSRRCAAQPSAQAQFTDGAMNDLRTVIEKSSVIASLTLESLRGGKGADKAVEIVMRDLKAVFRQSIRDHVERLQSGTCKSERGVVYVEVISATENIVRHLENIAQRVDSLSEAK